MRLYQLEYFIKIAECGSITRAAQELYLSQPSLTKAISGLETEYSLKLFSRTARGIRLTPEGRDFLEYAKSAVESCHALERVFGKKGNPRVQRLAVASQQFDFIYDILVCLYQKNSEQMLQIDLKENDRGEIVELVEKRKADIGLLVLSEADSKSFKSELHNKNLEMHILDTSSVYVSMGKHSELYEEKDIDVETAQKYLHVVLDTEQAMRRELRYGTIHQGIDHKHLIFCNTVGACQKFLEETDALLFTPKWVLGAFEGTEIRSVPLMLSGRRYPRVNRLVWIKRAREEFQPLEEQFMEILKERFQPAAGI